MAFKSVPAWDEEIKKEPTLFDWISADAVEEWLTGLVDCAELPEATPAMKAGAERAQQLWMCHCLVTMPSDREARAAPAPAPNAAAVPLARALELTRLHPT